LKINNSPRQSFDTSKLPEKLGRYVDSIVAATEAEPIMILMSVLCMMSAFVKRSCFIPESRGGQEGYFQALYPNIWSLCISPSGSFKTTALNKGFRLAYEHEKEYSGIEGSENVLLPNRTTMEGLLEDLSYGLGGAIVCSEFGAWLQSLERTYNQGLKSLFTDLYDVPEMRSYKTKSEGLKTIHKPFITICGVSTSEWIKENLQIDDISAGFFARFLIFTPPSNDRIPPALPCEGPSIDENAERDVKSIIEYLKAMEGERAYHLSSDARKAYEQFHNGMYEDFKQHRENSQQILAPYLKRWSPYVLKVAMLLQLFVDETVDEIGMEALNGAIAIVEHAINSTVWLFENDLGESPHQKKVRKVKDYIAKRGGAVYRRQLIQSRILEGGTKDYDYVLQTLEEAGEIVLANKGTKNMTEIKLTPHENDGPC